MEFSSDTPSFFQLLGEHFNISKFIPSVFVFYQPDDKFKNAHPEIPVEKKSESPNEDKSIGDSSSLNPILSNYFTLHPHFHSDTFVNGSSFDTIKVSLILWITLQLYFDPHFK